MSYVYILTCEGSTVGVYDDYQAAKEKADAMAYKSGTRSYSREDKKIEYYEIGLGYSRSSSPFVPRKQETINVTRWQIE